MQSTFFLGDSWHSCKVECAGGVSLSAGLYALAAGACSDLSFCPSYRNSKIQIRVEVTQSEDGNFLKSTIV